MVVILSEAKNLATDTVVGSIRFRGPSDLKIKELLERVKKEKFEEIIIATDFNTEGEATALYLIRQLKGSGAKITRVAYGIPVGSDIEYADQATISKAFEGRRAL